MKKKRVILIIGLLLIILIAGFWWRSRRGEKELKTVKVKKQNLARIVSASGKIKSAKEVNLKFQASGKLAWVGVKEGDQVKKWQAIASLDKLELQKNLEKELIDYMNERWDFEQDKDDYEDQIITDSLKRILEKAQFDLNRDVLDVEIADLALKLAVIVSPIDGIVTKVETPVAGINVTPATAEFIIADPNEVYFEARIDEADIAGIAVNQKALLVLDAYPDEEITAEVKQIGFQAESSSGGGTVFSVKISLPSNENLYFRLGMNGDAEIILEEKESVLTIPTSAVLMKNNKSYVFTVINNVLQEKEIQTGLETDSEIEIVQGLEAGEEIVVEKVKAIK